jgi:hypothetical protein
MFEGELDRTAHTHAETGRGCGDDLHVLKIQQSGMKVAA